MKNANTGKVLQGLTLLIVLLVLSRCISTNKLTTHNYSHLYKRSENPTRFRGRVFHHSDSNSLLMFRIYLPGLKYKQGKKNKKYYARYSLFYEMYDSYEKNTLIDSATVHYTDSLFFGRNKYLTHQIRLPLREKVTGLMEVTLADRNTSHRLVRYYRLNKTPGNSQQDFLIRNVNNEIYFPYFSRYFNRYHFQYRKEQELLHADIYPLDFPIARPPFATTGGSEITLSTENSIQLPQNTLTTQQGPGLYRIESEAGERFCLFYVAEGSFPAPNSVDMQIKTLRYITTGSEYSRIERANEPQRAIDNFWYRASGDIERAGRMQERYYSRVEQANTLFTSHKAGWKTDRGMIYIVMGPPDVVKFFENSELWVYGDPEKIDALRFTFQKKEKPFSYNNYVLKRKEEYRLPWYRAVENWKK